LELIVADNGSTDKTVSLAKEFGAIVIERPKATIAELRNTGAQRAKGSIVAFVDADTVVDKGWLRAAVRHFVNGRIGAVGSRLQYPHDAPWIERVWAEQQKERNYRGEINWLGSANLVVSRECFERVGGFDASLRTSEDVELCSRIRAAGYVIFSDPEVRATHLANPKNLWSFFKRELWYGKDTLRMCVQNRSFRKEAKVLVLAILYAVTLLSTPFAIYALVSQGLLWPVCLAAGILFGPPVIRATMVAIRIRRPALFVQLVVLYLIYGVGRGVALLNPDNWLSASRTRH
jgi:cellulose synthase/poly-beta-1,6-N-acetylglucosamine synthase-like glycosyltransferase